MSVLTYCFREMMNGKPLRWLHGEVKTPPMGTAARREMGMWLRDLQEGETLIMPHSRPMPSIGRRCHELRVNDENKTWRLIYRLDPDAILILEVFEKKTKETPQEIIQHCQRQLKLYEGIKP